MKEAVFTPLGMENTDADRYESVILNRTSFYKITDEGELRHALFTDNSDLWAGGGFLSTPSDLVAFASGLMNDILVQPETRELLFEPMRTADGKERAAALGWFIHELKGYQTVGHTGGHFGASSFLLIIPEKQIVIAAMANVYNEQFYEMTLDLATLYLTE